MPPQRPKSSGAETARLADLFVRLPSGHEYPGQPTPPASNGPPLMPPSHKRKKKKKDRKATISKSYPPTPIAPAMTHLPPTPDPTPTKRAALKRSFQPDPQTPSPLPKRHRPTPTILPPPTPTTTPSPSPRHQHHPPYRPFPPTPSFSIVHHQPPPQGQDRQEQPSQKTITTEKKKKKKSKSAKPPQGESALSWLELKRVAESVLRQVDWDEVEEDVASNRGKGAYRRAVRDVLQERIEELL